MLIEQGEDGEGIGLAGAGLFGRHIIEGKRDAIKLRFDLRDDQPGPFYLKRSSGKFIHNYPRHNYGSVRAGIVDGGLLGNGWMSLFGVELGYSTDTMIEYCTSVVNSAGRFGSDFATWAGDRDLRLNLHGFRSRVGERSKLQESFRRRSVGFRRN